MENGLRELALRGRGEGGGESDGLPGEWGEHQGQAGHGHSHVQGMVCAPRSRDWAPDQTKERFQAADYYSLVSQGIHVVSLKPHV